MQRGLKRKCSFNSFSSSSESSDSDPWDENWMFGQFAEEEWELRQKGYRAIQSFAFKPWAAHASRSAVLRAVFRSWAARVTPRLTYCPPAAPLQQTEGSSNNPPPPWLP